jgi:hypothetical protein
MTKDEALKLALEALEYLMTNKTIHYTYRNKAEEAITAVQEVIAAPVQEPVAWIEHHKGGDNLEWDNPGGKCTPLYTTPPAQPAPEEDLYDLAVKADNWGQP